MTQISVKTRELPPETQQLGSLLIGDVFYEPRYPGAFSIVIKNFKKGTTMEVFDLTLDMKERKEKSTMVVLVKKVDMVFYL